MGTDIEYGFWFFIFEPDSTKEYGPDLILLRDARGWTREAVERRHPGARIETVEGWGLRGPDHFCIAVFPSEDKAQLRLDQMTEEKEAPMNRARNAARAMVAKYGQDEAERRAYASKAQYRSAIILALQEMRQA